ncbi:MAG: GNAT family N-acetyltransferase [Alphaproteobacteria bacterium]|nr:GNAT family N-acetyltransferase [Alphaproteobacteria bacterium]
MTQTTYRIRLARPDDLPRLPEIDSMADSRFGATSYRDVLEAFPAVTVDHLTELQDQWRLWVAAAEQDRPVGFAMVSLDAPAILHLDLVAVDPSHAGHRLASRLIAGIDAFCAGRGLTKMTLTTFRDVPWNAPYYERLGFREIADSEADADPFLGPRLRDQVAKGLPRESRIAMVRDMGTPLRERDDDRDVQGLPVARGREPKGIRRL